MGSLLDLAGKRGLFTYGFEELPFSSHPPRVPESHNLRDTNERLLLKLHYADGLNIDRIGALFQLHRSTVARRLHGQRRKLLELTRARLRERLSLSDSEFDSVLALVRSQMVVSLRTALK